MLSNQKKMNTDTTNNTQESKCLLNSSQQRHLLSSCEYVDGLLSEIESVLSASGSQSPFLKYHMDLSPVQKKVALDFVARIRTQMVRALNGMGITLQSPRIGVTRMIRTNLNFADIAIDELRPQYMRGYGSVSESVIPELNGIVTELSGLVGTLNLNLAQGWGADFEGRLIKLDQTIQEVDWLKALEKIISEHGLVEFRSPFALILDRMEENRFEIAVFGRVNSGKSSLLNFILESEWLPVGVNPITAVPTRLAYGPHPRVTIGFADRPTEHVGIEQLSGFASERENTANVKRVTRLLVELPSARLKDGVVFVDPPGLGSLASAGAEETLAYLPRCDLGIVLIDSGSTLSPEDLKTLQVLYGAAIPAIVLLSKADLLSTEDLEKASNYIQGQIAESLGLELSVHPVSVWPNGSSLLLDWLNKELQPMLERHQELGQQSLRRKVGALRETVEAALRIRLERMGQHSHGEDKRLQEMERFLRRISGKCEEVRQVCDRTLEAISSLGDQAIARAATHIVRNWRDRNLQNWNLGDWVTQSIIETVTEQVGILHESIQRLSRELSGSLGTFPLSLGFSEKPVEDELDLAVGELPRLDLPAFHLHMRFPLLSTFGEGIAKVRVESAVRKKIEPAIKEVFQSYSEMLRAWTSETLHKVERQFNSHADGYRAQLDRMMSAPGESSRERDKLVRNLEVLRKGPTVKELSS